MLQRFNIMGRFNMSCALIFHILLFFFFIDHIAASGSADDGFDPCANVNCGQGKCVISSGSLLGFDCVCSPGWTKMPISPITFPACTIPNCTINYECSNGVPLPPLPPPANSPPINLLNPCDLVWCGDGTCVANQLEYYCKCNEGSANLFNLTTAACLNDCYLGADCKGVAYGPPLSSPPSPGNEFGSAPSPRPSSSPSPPPKKDSSILPNCSTSLGQVTILLLCLIFLASIHIKGD